MAEQIHYRPADARRAPGDESPEIERLEARVAEINSLLDELYASGIIRWLKDLAGAMPQVSEVVTDGLNTPGGRAGLRNLMVVTKQLGRIDPDRLEHTLAAANAGIDQATQKAPEDSRYNPPGVTGMFRLLHDEQLWQALAPVIEGVKTYAAASTQAQDSAENEPDDARNE